MGIRLKRGRLAADGEKRCAANINESTVRIFFPADDPIGLEILLAPDGKPCTIAGIVSNSSDHGLDVEVQPIVYVPISQTHLPPLGVHLLVRAVGDPLAIVSIVRDQIRSVDPDQPIYNVRTMEEKLAASITPRRYSMILLNVFAGLALALAIVGIYAVMFASVSERVHEIGIRVALGAERGDVLKLIAGQGARLVIAGLILGIAGSWAATRLLKTMLYGVSTTDPWIFVLVPFLLMAVAMIASLIPALRATQVDPVVALRQE
jgi:putative ABC transport system permease protein